jgi:hypothetical protein
MSRVPDPRWIGVAGRVYSACLWLYPTGLRQEHGEEMLLAFRDRCREVASGKGSAWRVLGLELFPDLLHSAMGAQVELGVGTGQRRAYGGLILLCSLAVALLTQAQWSGPVSSGLHKIELYWLMVRDVREMKRYEKAIDSVASELESRGDPQSRALAALAYRSLFDQLEVQYLYADERGFTNLRLPEEGARAAALAEPLVAQAADAYTLSLATQACALSAGCNRDLAIRRLTALDPDNAFGWMLAFKWASQHQQPKQMQLALEKIGSARYYENYQGRAHRDLFAAAARLRPDDSELLRDVANHAEILWQVDTGDFENDIRVQCSLREGGNIPVHWVQLHPENRADCLHLARLLVGSTDVWGATWGWRQLARAGEVTTAPQMQARRDAIWLYRGSAASRGQTRNSDDPNDHSYRPWGPAEWKMWAEAWKPGDGQTPSMRRWLNARGLPTTAPDSFQVYDD